MTLKDVNKAKINYRKFFHIPLFILSGIVNQIDFSLTVHKTGILETTNYKL
jgi:hypothetical protein